MSDVITNGWIAIDRHGQARTRDSGPRSTVEVLPIYLTRAAAVQFSMPHDPDPVEVVVMRKDKWEVLKK